MFAKLFSALFGRFFKSATPAPQQSSRDFEKLNEHAPIKTPSVRENGGENAPEPDIPASFLCRETILGRDERVAGYQFMLHEGTRNRIRSRSRRIHHVYAEVLVRNVVQLDIPRLLGHRQAFLDVPDSFLSHPSITDLPPENTVLVVETLYDEGAPEPAALLDDVKRLRQAGFRIAVPDTGSLGELVDLLREADYLTVATAGADPERITSIANYLKNSGSRASLVARDLPSHEDFQLCFTMGATLFQGSFITSRQDWRGNKLGPNTARMAEMLARLRRDADTVELVELLKQDPALSLRLMHYINSASIGLREPVSSIERAVLQLGRDKLYRWVMLLMYGADKGNTRKAAVLESALVRARLMELLGEGRPTEERDALFLVGLLSLVDVVLQVPMEEAMASLATSPAIEAAVVRREGPMAKLLKLAIACESGDASDLGALAEQCGVKPELATRRHLEAFTWAMEVNA